MDEFIKVATEKLGIGEAESRSAASGIPNLIRDKLDGGDFTDLMDKLPGAEALLGAADTGAGATGGGLMGGMLGKAASMLGGEAGAALDLTTCCRKPVSISSRAARS